MNRCRWCSEQNPLYVRYHDEEWGKRQMDDPYLFEMLLLESFQAGLSWECILNKRESFRRAFDGFDVVKISGYGEEKTALLSTDTGIVRNRRKISASIKNAAVFIEIQKEFGTFCDYLLSFCGDEPIYEYDKTHSELSDRLSADLKKRGMGFVGTTILYSYLQAIGIINSHEPSCFLYRGEKTECH